MQLSRQTKMHSPGDPKPADQEQSYSNPKATRIGLITITGSNPDEPLPPLPPPRFEIIWTITNPITSSIMAALPSTTPSRVLASSVVERMVNVVPMLVDDSAAPAANAWREVAASRCMWIKERPMGTPTPVTATRAEKMKFDFIWEKDVDRPPLFVSSRS